MFELIYNKECLDKYIDKFGDYAPDYNYTRAKISTQECYPIFGCEYASEAFESINDDSMLIITDNYNEKWLFPFYAKQDFKMIIKQKIKEEQIGYSWICWFSAFM